MGAWIEILRAHSIAPAFLSLLSWERGLKYVNTGREVDVLNVAPLVGAWIEIGEIAKIYGEISSLLSWERGLKSQRSQPIRSACMSLLSWERGLKY